MDDDHRSDRAPFFRIESLPVMSSHASVVSDATSGDEWERPPRHGRQPQKAWASTPTATASASPVVLAVQPLRSRTLVLTVVVVAALVGLTLTFLQGVALKEFDANDLTAQDQATLLDDYNSYSGNVASIFSKPVEMFVTLGVQVVVLTFLVDAVVSQPARSWKAGVAALVLASGVGYLVRNGITALNVQLQVREIVPMMNAADLTVLVNASVSTLQQSSTVERTLSELAPENAATNTMLRNLLLPTALPRSPQCPQAGSEWFETIADPSLQLSLPRFDWQTRVLPTALNATASLRVVVNASSPATATKPPTPVDLPMDASLAADLFLYAMIEAPRSLPWGLQLGFPNRTQWYERFPLQLTTGTDVHSDVGFMADITQLLPPVSDHADETAKRAWFLRELTPATTRQFNQSENTSLADISLTFAHYDLSPTLRFDALTIEADVDPRLLTDTTMAGTRYTNVPLVESCAQWPGLCLLSKFTYSKQLLVEFDVPTQIQMLSPCTDAAGNETLTLRLEHRVRGYVESLQCHARATSSVYVLSVAKRLVADTIELHKAVNASSGVGPDPTSALVTNLRKIYSFTVGRLSWTLDDLATTFHADCIGGSDPNATNCLGLTLPLAAAAASASEETAQRLVVGAASLPFDQLVPYDAFLYAKTRRTTLARVYEPSQPARDSTNARLAGDVLLPHNIKQITWDATTKPTTCNDLVEERLRLTVDNHLYSEHSLQPAYTAATLFLFQNAVVRDVLTINATAETLNFDGNAQLVALWLSIPTQNAWLTLGGCALLVVALGVAMVGTSQPLASISEPQTIVRVLLNDKLFPPLLLHRHVTGVPSSSHQPSELDQYEIASLSLQPTRENRERLEATVSETKGGIRHRLAYIE